MQISEYQLVISEEALDESCAVLDSAFAEAAGA